MRSFSRGILALLLVSGILLISDLQNRNRKSDLQKQAELDSVAGPDSGIITGINLDTAVQTKALQTTEAVKPTLSSPLPKGKKFKLCLAHYVDSPNSEECEKGIRKALKDINLVEGRNFTLKVFNAQGDISTLNSIAESIGNEDWDLVFAISTPCVQLLAKKLQRNKIVFTNVGDPVAAGLGKSFDKHLPHLCGISTMSDFDGLLRLVKMLHPGFKRIGTVYTPAEINSVSYKDKLAQAASRHGLKLVAVPANAATEVLDAANSLVAQQIDAFCQISDNLTGSCSAAILKAAGDAKVPYYGFVSGQMKQGAIAVCARDYFQAGYDAGEMGIEVLGGKKPGSIPYRFVQKTDFMMNTTVARAYSITIPQKVYNSFPQLAISH